MPAKKGFRTGLSSLRLTRFLRKLSTKSTFQRLQRKQQKAQTRLALLEQETRAQLLELKELQQEREMLEHRMQELYPAPLILLPPPTEEQLEQLAKEPGRLWVQPQ